MAAYSSILAWRIRMDRGAWWAAVYGRKESDTTEPLSTVQCVYVNHKLLIYIFKCKYTVHTFVTSKR